MSGRPELVLMGMRAAASMLGNYPKVDKDEAVRLVRECFGSLRHAHFARALLKEIGVGRGKVVIGEMLKSIDSQPEDFKFAEAAVIRSLIGPWDWRGLGLSLSHVDKRTTTMTSTMLSQTSLAAGAEPAMG